VTELGGGDMSRVWVATETALGRQVVVKVIAPELAEGLSAERFTREVRLAARLQQSNVVPVLSTGDAEHVAAVALLSEAIAEHDVWVVQFPRSLRYDKLRRDPRVAAMLDQLGTMP